MKTGYNFEKSPRSHREVSAPEGLPISLNLLYIQDQKRVSRSQQSERSFTDGRGNFNPLNLSPSKRRDGVGSHFICLYMVWNHKNGYPDIKVSLKPLPSTISNNFLNFFGISYWSLNFGSPEAGDS